MYTSMQYLVDAYICKCREYVWNKEPRLKKKKTKLSKGAEIYFVVGRVVCGHVAVRIYHSVYVHTLVCLLPIKE